MAANLGAYYDGKNNSNIILISIFIFSEVVLHQRLAADPEIITSQRYLSRDKKNGMNKMVTKMCKKYGFLEESAQFDPESVLAKVVFVRTHHMFSRILNYVLVVIVFLRKNGILLPKLF